MGHAHQHSSIETSASGKHLGRLVTALGLGAALLVLEVVVGVATSSLAVISDAAHLCTDVLGLGMAVTAVLLAARTRRTGSRTFGMYRAEVLAALANAVLLCGVAGFVLYSAIRRADDPPHVAGLPVLLTAVAALMVNTVAFALLRSGAKQSLNLRGAYLEVLADAAGSLGLLLSGAITLATGWPYTDLIIGVAIGLWVLPRTIALARRALRILFQHAPGGLDMDDVSTRLSQLPGVREVHDLHVWTLTSGMEVATAHIATAPDVDTATVLGQARRLLASRYGIQHTTVQVEPGDAGRCGRVAW